MIKEFAVICHTDGVDNTKPFVVEADEIHEKQQKADEASGGEWWVKVVHRFELDTVE